MAKAPWIRWFWSDWIADTAHLGHTEKGIYIALLEQYYQHRKPLPADFEDVCRLARVLTPEERRACLDVLAEFFLLDDTGPTRCWRHKRADEEINHADGTYSRKVIGASKARAARTLISDMTSDLISGHNQNQNRTTTTPLAAPRNRGSRLPPDWRPDPSQLEYAHSLGLDPTRTFLDFADYWLALPGQRAVKLDWNATWRRWCRKASESLPKPPSNRGPALI